MAFVKDLDTRTANVLGNGSPVSEFESQVFYTEDTDITGKYNPYAPTSTWFRVKGSTLKTTEKNNQTAYYDQFEEIGVKSGRIETTFELAQDFTGTSESISKLKNKELWFAEGVQDDRNLLDSSNTPIFYEVNFYKAKMVDMAADKSSTWKITGSGKYNTKTKFTVIKDVTPVNLTLTSDGSAVSGVAETMTVSATDLYSNSIALGDLTIADLAGEISSLTVEKVTGTATVTVAQGVDSKTFQVTLTGTAGTNTLRAKAVTINGGVYYSPSTTVTLS